MVKSGSPMKSALVAAVLLAVIRFGSAGDKLAECCTSVSQTRINEPITGYMIQRAHSPCVPAVIIQTATGVYCVHVKAPGLRAKIQAFEEAKREATTKPAVPSSTVSLLSIITSTASPASASASISTATSFPPASQTPADETFAENYSK